jgi:septal ring factor EnvC (AmiA/AmiB activator)
LPRPGCYYAMRLSYSSTLNDESLDQAVEKESRRAERAKRNAERQRKLEEREAKKKAAKTKKARKQLEDEEGNSIGSQSVIFVIIND